MEELKKKFEKFKKEHSLLYYMIFGMVVLTGGLLIAGSPIILSVVFNTPWLLFLYIPLVGACIGAGTWVEENY